MVLETIKCGFESLQRHQGFMTDETRDKLLIEIAKVLVPIATDIKFKYDKKGQEIIKKIIVDLIKIRHVAEQEIKPM